MAIIRALVTAGANIHLSNHFGGTCLINSVQSVDLVKFLIRHGADVNAEDVQHKTALHYAIQVSKYRVSQKYVCDLLLQWIRYFFLGHTVSCNLMNNH